MEEVRPQAQEPQEAESLMSEWPQQAVCASKEKGVVLTPVIPADLGRELYEALVEELGYAAQGGGQRQNDVVARYEREILSGPDARRGLSGVAEMQSAAGASPESSPAESDKIEERHDPETCPACLHEVACAQETPECSDCGGSGQFVREDWFDAECPSCHGSGSVLPEVEK